jgi:hypothetical protein
MVAKVRMKAKIAAMMNAAKATCPGGFDNAQMPAAMTNKSDSRNIQNACLNF